MKVPFPNAFTINTMGFGAPFPVSVSCHQSSTGAYGMGVVAQRLKDLHDLLAWPHAVATFGVGHSLSDQATSRLPTLREAALDLEIDCHVIDDETVVFLGEDFVRLIDGLGHYSLCAFDVPEGHTDSDVIINVLTCDDHNWAKNDLPLPHISGATFYLDSHDDCYLHLEAYDLDFLKSVFVRTLQIFVGTVLFASLDVDIEIADIPWEFLDHVWPMDSALTIMWNETYVAEQQLVMGISPEDFRLSRMYDEYPVNSWIGYDFSTGEWLIFS
jgi:hypothetical protein